MKLHYYLIPVLTFFAAREVILAFKFSENLHSKNGIATIIPVVEPIKTKPINTFAVLKHELLIEPQKIASGMPKILKSKIRR